MFVLILSMLVKQKSFKLSLTYSKWRDRLLTVHLMPSLLLTIMLAYSFFISRDWGTGILFKKKKSRNVFFLPVFCFILQIFHKFRILLLPDTQNNPTVNKGERVVLWYNSCNAQLFLLQIKLSSCRCSLNFLRTRTFPTCLSCWHCSVIIVASWWTVRTIHVHEMQLLTDGLPLELSLSRGLLFHCCHVNALTCFKPNDHPFQIKGLTLGLWLQLSLSVCSG